MPTPIPAGEKSAFIAIVAVRNPQEAVRLQTLLNNYEDVPMVIGRQQDDFAANNLYLTAAMNTLNNASLQSVGVYFARNLNVQPSPPAVMLVNVIATGGVDINTSPPGFAILGTSNINEVELGPTVRIPGLYIGPGSVVDVLDGTQTVGVSVNNLYLPFMRSNPSALNMARFGTIIGNIEVAEGSYFGGYLDDDPESACNIPVTDLIATEATQNGLFLSWTPPAPTSPPVVFINTYYKKSNSSVWIPADESVGEFVGNTGFVFRELEPDTFYDFKVVVVCGNGGTATAMITTQTVCCGAGTILPVYKYCQITFLITSVADSPPGGQVLCNGEVINLHYPPGTTITVPYLATVNCAVVSDMVIDNAIFQGMPFNRGTGTWDASGTSVQGFNEGSVVTVGMSLPA